MQFIPWFEIYEKNKDSIKDKEQFFLEWRKKHKEFLERFYQLAAEYKCAVQYHPEFGMVVVAR